MCARKGDHVGAAAQYRIMADIHPRDVRLGLKLAHHLLSAGRYRQAADEYLRLAALYAERGHHRRAMTVAQQGLRLDASRATRRRLEPIIARLGKAAEKLCEEAARMHMLADRRDQVNEIHRLLVEHDPSCIGKRLRLAEHGLAEGRTEEALANLRIVAEGLRARGRTDEFVRVAEMMLAHGASDPWALRQLAQIYIRDGNLEGAVRRLQALARVAPTDLFALERLVWAHAASGEADAARETLGRLVETMAESRDRGELRALLARAEKWSSDDRYQRELEMLRVEALCDGVVPRRSQHKSPAVPPPPPSRRPYRLATPPPPVPTVLIDLPALR
ncbi:MAG: hypothetical protein AAF721_01725 [Myxococcota bacterium]